MNDQASSQVAPRIERPGWGVGLGLSAWSIVAAFGTYSCMYAFRKPFTAAEFNGITLWGIDYKTILVAAQVFGYMISKFIGIKIVAELKPQYRALCNIALIGIAEVALLMFGLIPPPYNFLCLFLNGLPLGMVFGLVIGFLEGRQHTEALAAGLCASFIVADGFVKSVGGYLLDAGMSEFWMPFTTGLIFFVPLLCFVWMLTRIPPPSDADVAARSERTPMNRAERWRFFGHYAVGLTLLLLIYLLTTVLRSIRSDFAAEIWRELGQSREPSKFTRSEGMVGLGVILLTGAVVFIRGNRNAFFASLVLSIGGFVLLIVALLGLAMGQLSPFDFMVLYGLGLYLPYVTMQATLFERLIAMTRDRGNLGYLITLADAFGYLGFVVVMLVRKSFSIGEGFLDYFIVLSWVLVAGCLLMLIPCWRYFSVHKSTRKPIVPAIDV